MKMVWSEIKDYAGTLAQNKSFRKRAAWTLGIFLVLQIYFVRELIAAELLFGLCSPSCSCWQQFFIVVGTIGERGLDWAEVGVRAVASQSRRAYSTH